MEESLVSVIRPTAAGMGNTQNLWRLGAAADCLRYPEALGSCTA